VVFPAWAGWTNRKSQLADHLSMQTLALELVQEVRPPVIRHGQAGSEVIGFDVPIALSTAVLLRVRNTPPSGGDGGTGTGLYMHN